MIHFWLAAILLLQSQIPVDQIQPGTVTGRLLSTRGRPEAGVRIAAVPAADAEKGGAAALMGISLTDSDGRYRLEKIPPGRYYIFAGLIDLPSYYPSATTIDRATAIFVDAGETVSGIDFSMSRPTSMMVTGRLDVPSTMQHVVGWAVTLSPVLRGSGGATPVQVNVAEDGTFEFPRVVPGDYQLASNVRGSSAITLRVIDTDLSGIVMPVVDCNAGASVSGKLIGTSPTAISTVSLLGSRVGCSLSSRPGPDGTFVFEHVPDGTYQLSVAPAPLGWNPIPLRVDRTNLENLAVQLPTLIAIKGRADVEDGSSFPRLTRGTPIVVQAIPATGGGQFVTSPILEDGSFELRLPRGRYRIYLQSTPGGYLLKSMKSGSIDLSRSYLEVSDETLPDIELTLGLVRRPEPPGVRVSGRVMFPPAGDMPRSEGVLLVSSSGSRNVAVRESILSADGSFEFTGVSPGTYNIETFPDNPAALYGIVVNKTDVSGVEYVLPALIKVKGGIEWMDTEGSVPPASRPPVSVQFTRREGNKVFAWAALAQAGAFHFYLPEGDYRFSVSDIPSSFDLGSVTAGDANILEDGLRIRSDFDPPNLRVMLRAK